MDEKKEIRPGDLCAGIREGLSPYLEGELSGEERGRIEEHIGRCPECRLDLELLRHTVSALRDLPDLPAPAGILKGVRQGLQPQPWYRRLGAFVPVPNKVGIPVGAAATLLVAFGIFLMNERFPEMGRMPDTSLRPVEIRPVPAPREEAAREVFETADDSNLLSAVEKEMPPAPEEALPRAPALLDEPVPEGKVTVLGEDVISAPAAPTAGNVRGPLPAAPSVAKNEKARADLDSYRELKGAGELRRQPEEPATPGPSLERAAEPPPHAAPPPPKPVTKYKAALKKKAAVTDALPEGYYRKSLPPRGSREMQQMLESSGRESLLQEGEEVARLDRSASRIEETEVLTIFSFGEDEVKQVRESLEESGGTMLEMQVLDYGASQQVALPFQDRLNESQVISQGWQIRALVPVARVEDFVSSLEGQSSFQLLERSRAPASKGARPGSQSFEIRLLR